MSFEVGYGKSVLLRTNQLNYSQINYHQKFKIDQKTKIVKFELRNWVGGHLFHHLQQPQAKLNFKNSLYKMGLENIALLVICQES